MGYLPPPPPVPPQGTPEFEDYIKQKEEARKAYLRWKLKWHLISKEDAFLEEL